MKVAYVTTFEWPVLTLQECPELVDDTMAATLAIISDLSVTVDKIGPGWETPAVDWMITGLDLDEAARRLDIDVQDK